MTATPEHAARVLNLSLTATLGDVRRVRRKMALKYHPDFSADWDKSTRHMARINAAADTLVAYIKKQNVLRSGSARNRPGYSGNQKHCQSSKRYGETIRTSSPRRSHARKPEQKMRPDFAAQQVRVVKKPKERTDVSRADNALIRLASASYMSVLDRIGSKESGPQIDVSILRFQRAY